MNWLVKFFTSSIGRKVIMSLTGLFLVTFLIVHLAGNLQLLYDDEGKAFNIYAHFMSTNAFIQFIAKGLYLFIILHTIQGLMIWSQNRSARSEKYAVTSREKSLWSSRHMALLGTLVLAFLFLHMGDFWFKIKFDPEAWKGAMVAYDSIDYQVKDVYSKVELSFAQPWIVVAYLIGLVALAFHLQHGFQSAFQTLGLRHSKYTPTIKALGNLFAIILPVGFAIIPLYMFFS
ncbi:MAG: succinate dehydrogenase cytochrome b subunit [Saprospiraceae bacterium]|nr:succinate dehydrogenase cytochrome b subunit [Saprospiraceae bacterium]